MSKRKDVNKTDKTTVKKATPSEKKRRINQVVKLLKSGFTSFSYVEQLNDKEGWNLERRQLERYHKWARDEVMNEGAFFTDKSDVIKYSFSLLQFITQKAIQGKDYELLLRVIKEQNKMYGIYEHEHFVAKEDKKTGKHMLSADEILLDIEDDE